MTPEPYKLMDYRSESAWSFPARWRAHLTLGGLVISDGGRPPRDDVGGYFPWQSLAPYQQGFVIVDVEGRWLHCGRRTLVPTCQTGRGQRLARRAHRRAIRRALADGAMDVTVRFQSMKWTRRIMLSVLVLMLGFVAVMIGPALLRGFGPRSAGHSNLVWITVSGVVLLMLLMGAGYGLVIYRLTDSNIRRIRFRGGGLDATLEGGGSVSQRWADLRSITERTGSWRLDFVDGTRLRVLGRGMARIIMQEVRRAHDVEAEGRIGRGHVHTAIRLLIICQLAGGFAGWLSAMYGVGRSPLAMYLFFGVVFPAVPVLAILVPVVLDGKFVPRQCRRRGRGRAAPPRTMSQGYGDQTG